MRSFLCVIVFLFVTPVFAQTYSYTYKDIVLWDPYPSDFSEFGKDILVVDLARKGAPNPVPFLLIGASGKTTGPNTVSNGLVYFFDLKFPGGYTPWSLLDYPNQQPNKKVPVTHFGARMVKGDFNCDGEPDIAVAVTGVNNQGSKLELGEVDVFFGPWTIQPSSILENLNAPSYGGGLPGYAYSMQIIEKTKNQNKPGMSTGGVAEHSNRLG